MTKLLVAKSEERKATSKALRVPFFSPSVGETAGRLIMVTEASTAASFVIQRSYASRRPARDPRLRES
jgi:hypothetical protein